MTLLTWDWTNPNPLDVRTHIFQVNNSGELLFENDLNAFPDVTGRIFDFAKLKDGGFLFYYDKLYKVSEQFEPNSSITLSNHIHEFIEGPNGNIYIGGTIPSESSNFLLKLNKDLEKINEITFDNKLSFPLEDWLDSYAFEGLAIHDNKLYCMEVAYEYIQELRLQCFDLDLNRHSEFILEGSRPFPEIKINELGSASFLFGAPFSTSGGTPDLTTPTEARLFKLDIDCQVPEKVIIN